MGRRRMKTNGDEKETHLAETTATYALGVFCQLVRKIEAKHPPLKPLKSRIRNFQRAGEGEVWGVFRRSLARLLAKKKEETEEDVHKFKEDWGNIDKEAWQVPLGGA